MLNVSLGHETRVLERFVWLPQPIGQVFAFFSDAYNLEILTPAFPLPPRALE